MNNKQECPLCDGEGEVPYWKMIKLKPKEKIAKALKSDGYSVREIQKLLGYKSSRSVQSLLEN